MFGAPFSSACRLIGCGPLGASLASTVQSEWYESAQGLRLTRLVTIKKCENEKGGVAFRFEA